MKCIRLGARGGLDRLDLTDAPDPGAPASGDIRVRLHATSLNFHDYKVVTSDRPQTTGLIPMADGNNVVKTVDDKITNFTPNDHITSTFFPK